MKTSLCESLPFGRSLAILAKSYYGALTKRLEHLEIERYYSILILIEDSEDVCSQQNICDNLKMDKVSMVRILNYLVQKKYVRKVLNPNDKREYLIALTKKAIGILPEIHAAIDEVNKSALKGLTKEKQKELYTHLSLIQQNLNNLPAQRILSITKKQTKDEVEINCYHSSCYSHTCNY